MQDNYKSRISFISFADMKLPEMKEVPNKGYISFGEDNLYPNELLRMFNKSSKHNAVVLGKVNYIVGKGFTGGFTPNPSEDINELLKKCSIDIEVFGGCYIEEHWKDGKCVSAYHLPYQKVRSNEDNTQFIVKDWTSLKRNEKQETILSLGADKRDGKYVIFYKEYRPGIETYTLPVYVGALNAIETDIEISKYHLSNIKNGMFSSKMINFNQGVPSEEEQKNVEKRFKGKFTGSDNAGSIVVTFNDDPAKAPTILDLSGTELDKHFEIVNKKVEQDIFAGHQITSPILFGIKTEGQLGGRSEIRDAYEIFKSTYCNDKQQSLERLFTEINKHFGGNEQLTITPLDPIQEQFSEQTLLQIAPKEWMLEKAGIDVSKYPTSIQPEQQLNDSLANISGRQQQQLMRIVRLFTKGQLTKVQAALQLKAFGLSDADVNAYLGLDDDPLTDDFKFSSQDEDEKMLFQFSQYGESKDNYSTLITRDFNFAEILSSDAAILDLIKKDKRITPEVLASTLKIKVSDVRASITQLEAEGYLTSKAERVGNDVVITRTLSQPLSEITDKKPRTTDYKVMYSYEGPKDDRNRAFCAKLLELNRFYSRPDIERISRNLGYSVWDRRGGWWSKPDGTRSVSCRHKWKSNLVIQRK